MVVGTENRCGSAVDRSERVAAVRDERSGYDPVSQKIQSFILQPRGVVVAWWRNDRQSRGSASSGRCWYPQVMVDSSPKAFDDGGAVFRAKGTVRLKSESRCLPGTLFGLRWFC